MRRAMKMAKAATRATSLTTLVIGSVEIPIGLFSTVEKPGGLAEFATAGPNGGVLKAVARARPVPVEENTDAPDAPVHSDPLADAPGGFSEPRSVAEFTTGDPRGMTGVSQGRPMLDPEACGPYGEVDGQYGRELVEEGSGVVVLPQDVRRGVRLEDGRFIDCTDQLAEIDAQTRLDRAVVIGFVDITRVPRARGKAAQYIGAGDEEAPRALRLLFEALRRSRRGAVVKLTKKSRQTLGVIGWLGKCLVLYEQVWAEDFREPPDRATRIQKAQVSEQEIATACQLIEAMGVTPDVMDELRDDAIALREQLMLKALSGEVAEVVTPMLPAATQDVMAQLEASLQAVGS